MIHKEALRFIVPLLLSASLAAALGLYLAGILLLFLAAFVAFFFRNPAREIPTDPRVIVSPADGRIVKIERVGNVTKLSIFLSIFDVHVNRSPIGGRIDAIDYKRGKFKPAFNHAASIENERNTIMVSAGDVKLVFTQIAGILARRIVCWKKVGDTVAKGELIGLIRFGSRVDVLFPAGTDVTVRAGARVLGGSTPIGMML
ncbi:MAG: phosphatidylserine decarboxylase family protein [Acidobacteria bacterium]|nr:MAG: phosphatidylserine decarboxylase family protein [Acidobacteriota bacterium]PYS14562.1 MAG: phosphatidylserine decarboxylase family protein [Acidobacteriota bacterium]